jgi:outer membrane protein TolC
MKKIFFSILLCTSTFFGQNTAPNEFTYNEFLGFVKKYHPLVKSANLNINQAQANLLMARGAFDPKIEIE